MYLTKDALLKFHKIQPQSVQLTIPPKVDSDEGFKLKRIKIPKFTGRYKDWTALHKLFKIMEHYKSKIIGNSKTIIFAIVSFS